MPARKSARVSKCWKSKGLNNQLQPLALCTAAFTPIGGSHAPCLIISYATH